MPYATDNMISQSPIKGGIQISQQDYNDALQAMQEGRVVSIINGTLQLLDAPKQHDSADESSEKNNTDNHLAALTASQIRLALLEQNKLDLVDTAITTLPDQQQQKTQIKWDYAPYFHFDDGDVTALLQALDIQDIPQFWQHATLY